MGQLWGRALWSGARHRALPVDEDYMQQLWGRALWVRSMGQLWVRSMGQLWGRALWGSYGAAQRYRAGCYEVL